MVKKLPIYSTQATHTHYTYMGKTSVVEKIIT